MFNSLFIKGEKRLFKEIIELMDKIENCLELFKNFYILIKDNYESNKIDAIFLQINSLETEIDEKRRMIIEEIISGNFFSYIGESLIELLEKIDDIADYTKDATRVITENRLFEKEITKYVFNLKDLEDYIDSIQKSVNALSETIKCLGSKGKEALKLIKNIEKHEENADLLKISILKKHMLTNATANKKFLF